MAFKTHAGICFAHANTVVNYLDECSAGIFQNKLYVPLPNQYKRLPLMNMITSRGCRYKCAFCFEAGKFGQKHRRQSPRRVVDEITYMVDKFCIKEILNNDIKKELGGVSRDLRKAEGDKDQKRTDELSTQFNQIVKTLKND